MNLSAGMKVRFPNRPFIGQDAEVLEGELMFRHVDTVEWAVRYTNGAAEGRGALHHPDEMQVIE